jgi:hypothetical protein
MTVKEIAEHCLSEKNSLYQHFKDKGMEEAEIRNALMYHLEIFNCNILHVLYVQDDVVDLKDKQGRRITIRPDIWHQIEEAAKRRVFNPHSSFK